LSCDCDSLTRKPSFIHVTLVTWNLTLGNRQLEVAQVTQEHSGLGQAQSRLMDMIRFGKSPLYELCSGWLRAWEPHVVAPKRELSIERWLADAPVNAVPRSRTLNLALRGSQLSRFGGRGCVLAWRLELATAAAATGTARPLRRCNLWPNLEGDRRG
jgi:hypothetical protein